MIADDPTAPDGATRAEDPGGEVRSWWLVRLRWGSVAGRVLIILASWQSVQMAGATIVLPGLALAMVASNVALWLWLRRRRAVSITWSGAILTFDMLQLTALLHFSGGAANPFSVFYLVDITAAAVTLGSRWTWFLTVLGVSGYAALFAAPMATMGPQMDVGHGGPFSRHLANMWVALTLAAALTAFFVTRLTSSLALRDSEIAAMRESAARRARLAALTTLAAGAAHELATPLTTVAVVAGELERSIGSAPFGPDGKFGDDVRLIRAEVQRCRDILEELGRQTGNAAGEMPARFSIDAAAREVIERLKPSAASRVSLTTIGGGVEAFLPRRALTRVVVSLIQNALDASTSGQQVEVEFRADSQFHVRVHDQGAGMSSDVLARAEEPFFTTKPVGQGLGLGLFLARNFAEQLGGRLDIASTPGQGTTAHLDLPLGVGDHDQPS